MSCSKTVEQLYPVGSKVVRRVSLVAEEDRGLLVVWTVRSFRPASRSYVVDGEISPNWPATRVFYDHEIRAAP